MFLLPFAFIFSYLFLGRYIIYNKSLREELVCLRIQQCNVKLIKKKIEASEFFNFLNNFF